MAVLDLEDGYLDVRDPGKTSERRASGRRHLLELCTSAKGRTNGRPVAMRVNVAFSHSRAERTEGVAGDSPEANSVRRSRRQINTEPVKDFSHGLTRMGPIGLQPFGLKGMPRTV